MNSTKSLAQRIAEISRHSPLPGEESLAQRLANAHRASPLLRLVSCQMNAVAESKRFETTVEEAMALNSEISSFEEK